MLRLKFLRIDKGLSQGQLARYTSVNHSEISRIETGRLKPTRQQLDRLAMFFNCVPDRLLDHVADPGGGAEYLDAQREAGR